MPRLTKEYKKEASIAIYNVLSDFVSRIRKNTAKHVPSEYVKHSNGFSNTYYWFDDDLAPYFGKFENSCKINVNVHNKLEKDYFEEYACDIRIMFHDITIRANCYLEWKNGVVDSELINPENYSKNIDLKRIQVKQISNEILQRTYNYRFQVSGTICNI